MCILPLLMCVLWCEAREILSSSLAFSVITTKGGNNLTEHRKAYMRAYMKKRWANLTREEKDKQNAYQNAYRARKRAEKKAAALAAEQNGGDANE